MDMLDGNTLLVMATSIPILPGQDLLAPYNFGLGAIIPIAHDNSGRDAGSDDLGKRVKVWFLAAQ